MKARRRLWIVCGVSLCAAILGFFAYRSFTSLTIIPISEADFRRIEGHDLRFDPAKNFQPVDLDALIALSRQPDIRALDVPTPGPEFNVRIRHSWSSTLRVLRLIEGKDLPLPKGYDDPVTHAVGLTESDGVGLASFRSLSKMMAQQIRLAARERNAGRYFDACNAALDFQDFVDRQPFPAHIDYLIAIALRSIHYISILETLPQGVLSTEQLNTILRRIPVPSLTDDQLIRACRGEWALFSTPGLRGIRTSEDYVKLSRAAGDSHLMDLDEKRIDPCGSLDVPTTISTGARLLRIRLANCARPWSEQDPTADNEITRLEKQIIAAPQFDSDSNVLERTWVLAKYRSRMVSQKNSLGLQYIVWVAGMDHRLASFRTRTLTEALRLQVLFAIQRKNGGKVSSLNELRPLTGRQPFPRDLFTGDDFKYDPKRRLFWSVGPDGKDNGGSGTINRSQGDDYVWRAG